MLYYEGTAKRRGNTAEVLIPYVTTQNKAAYMYNYLKWRKQQMNPHITIDMNINFNFMLDLIEIKAETNRNIVVVPQNMVPYIVA